MSLTGKTAVITGSTSGIGFGLARGLADEGADIILNGFGDPDDIQKLVEEIKSKGVYCAHHPADMTKPEEIEDLIDQTAKERGGVDILINNAGLQHVCPVDEFPPEKWDQLIAVILSSAFHTTRKVLPLMKQAGGGRIINLASAHALVASPFKSAYVAAKHGLLGFTKTVALEVAEQNITVNAICPGYVKTPLVEGQIADTAQARGISEEEVVRDVMLAAQWTKEFVSIEQLAALTAFLCSDAAANITGTALPVDGGWTAA